MEQEQNPLDMPVHIVNGFQFRERSAKLMAYALDMKRLGATIDANFWDTRILDDDQNIDMVQRLSTTGPVIDRRGFDLFESTDRCRRNAAIVFDALIYGFDLMMQEFREAFLEESGVSPWIDRHNTNMFSRELLQYLTRPAEESDLLDLPTYRRQAAVLCDVEPVLLTLRVHNEIQYVWNGEWRALTNAPIETRRRQCVNWYYNHAFTIHRLRHMLSRYLYHKFPEQFGGKSA